MFNVVQGSVGKNHILLHRAEFPVKEVDSPTLGYPENKSALGNLNCREGC